MLNLANKFSFSAIKFDWQIATLLVFAWLVVIGACISSIYSQPFSKKQRVFWTVIVVCLPLVGMLFYLPFSVKHDDYPLIFNWKSKK